MLYCTKVRFIHAVLYVHVSWFEQLPQMYYRNLVCAYKRVCSDTIFALLCSIQSRHASLPEDLKFG